MPSSRRRKDRRTGKPVRRTPTGGTIKVRPVTEEMLVSFARGIYPRPVMRYLDLRALHDALCQLASQDRMAELLAIANEKNVDNLCKWIDMLAADNPSDIRWDEWRTYRRGLLAHAN